jgi:uncharacterized membrane protein
MSLESSKTLCGVGAILVALGTFAPFLPLVGIILLLIGMKGLSEYYNDGSIFRNALYGLVFGIIGIIAAAFAIIALFFGGALFGMSFGPGGAITGDIVGFIAGIIVALVVVFIFYILMAVFFKRAFSTLSEKTGEKMFGTAGLLLLIGAILTIVIVGLILILIAWILAAVAFFSIKTPAQPASPAQPSQQ